MKLRSNENSAKMDIYVTQSLVWGIYARPAKKIADSAQLILSLILVLTHYSFEKDAQCFVLPYNFSSKSHTDTFCFSPLMFMNRRGKLKKFFFPFMDERMTYQM